MNSYGRVRNSQHILPPLEGIHLLITVFIGKMNWDGGSLSIISHSELLFIMIYPHTGNTGLHPCNLSVLA